MKEDSDKLKVGLLGVTLEFYESKGPQTREGREKWLREKVLPQLSDKAEVHFEGACFRRADIERRILDFQSEGMDVILVICLTYSTSLASLGALKRTPLPIVIWNTQELYSVDESYGGAELSANHGVHGTFDLCNVLIRSGVKFGYVTSHLDDPDGIDKVVDALRSAGAVSKLRKMRLGLLGYPFPGMGDFGLDTTHMTATLGCEWEALSVAEFNRLCGQADSDQALALTEQYRAEYDVADNVTKEDLLTAGRAELALRSMISQYNLDAYSYQFLAFGNDDRSTTVPFVAASRLLAEGIGFGGEGDLIAAAYSALLNWLACPASFSEIFTIDFAGNSVLLSHMGEANARMHRKDMKLRLVKRETPIVPVLGSQLALAVNYQPGSATLTALTLAQQGRWRIIASPVTIPDFGPVSHLAVPHAKASPKSDVREFLTAYASAGGPHHMAVCFGDARSKLRLFAKLLDADYVEV